MKIDVPVLLTCVAFSFSACGQQEVLRNANVNFAYAKPNNVGMYDPKGTPAGTFYSWNTDTNRLTLIGEVELTPGRLTGPRSVGSTQISGLGIDGLPIQDFKLIEGKVGGQIKTSANNSVRQKYYDTITQLSAYVETMKSKGASERDVLDLFQPKNPSYRTVIFMEEERPTSTSIEIGGGGDDQKVASFEIQMPGGTDLLKIYADASSLAECGKPEGTTGERPVCYTSVLVYDPYIQENGKIGWSNDAGYDQAALSEALRRN